MARVGDDADIMLPALEDILVLTWAHPHNPCKARFILDDGREMVAWNQAIKQGDWARAQLETARSSLATTSSVVAEAFRAMAEEVVSLR